MKKLLQWFKNLPLGGKVVVITIAAWIVVDIILDQASDKMTISQWISLAYVRHEHAAFVAIISAFAFGVLCGHWFFGPRNRRALKLVQRTKELWREVLVLPSTADITRVIEKALFEIEKVENGGDR